MHRSPARTSRRRLGLGFFLAACLGAAALSAADDEFLVNQLTTGHQTSPDVAALAGGGFLVVWQSETTPGNDADLAVLGRQLDGLGSPTGDDFQINVFTTYGQRRPRIDSRADGSFVVVWATIYPGGKGALNALRARPFDTSGTGAPTDFVVSVAPNIYTSINSHDVGAADDSEFVVAFSRFYYGAGGSYNGDVVKRRFQSDGTQLESTTLTSGSDRELSTNIGGNAADGFVVATSSREYFGQYSDVEARRLDTSGVSVGSAIAVHGDQPFGFGGATGADVALAPNGEFVIAWNGYDVYNGSQGDIYGRFVSAGDVLNPAGPQLINTYTTGFDFPARIARGADGSFLTVWETSGAPGENDNGVRGRWLDSSGTPMGDAFAVNTYTTGNQRSPAVTASADGLDFLVVWYSANAPDDTDGNSIRGRRFSLPLFVDGFESGDTSAWSSTQP